MFSSAHPAPHPTTPLSAEGDTSFRGQTSHHAFFPCAATSLLYLLAFLPILQKHKIGSMPSKRMSPRTAGKGGDKASPATSTAEADTAESHPRKDSEPTASEYPIIEPASAYDLSKDPIHRYWAPDDPVVVVPRHVAKFQRADEAAVHLWPHNAKKLGMVRYIPPLTSEPLAIASSIGITNADGEWEYVWFAFAYT